MMKTYKESLKARCMALLITAACFTGISAEAQAQLQSKKAIGSAPAVVSSASSANPAGVAAAVSISNKIQFHGQVPDSQTNARFDPLDVCPNVVDPSTHGIQSQSYQFQFESNCQGESGAWSGCARPNFIWTIKYFTESGTWYQEKWQDMTSGDFSKIRLYLYDRVPYAGTRFLQPTPTNGQATQAGGNTNFSAMPYPNPYCINAPGNTATAGELITHVQLECSGYRCGGTSGLDEDAIQIRYYGRRPDGITIGGGQPLCRNVTYPISVNPVFAATNYLWYTSGLNGASIYAVNGNNATLDVSGVPAGTSSITLRVAARDNAHCGGITSGTYEMVVNIAQSPGAPQNLTLSNGLCPTSPGNTKTASITPGAAGTVYSWTVSGAGATIFGANSGADLTAISLYMPQTGSVTVSVQAKTADCGGYSAPLTQTFQIGNVLTVPVSGITQVSVYCSADYWCYDHSNHVVVDNPQPGLKYRMFINNVMPAETNPDPFYHTKVLQSGDGSPSGDIYIAGPLVRSFDLIVVTENPCPAPGTPASSFFSKTYNIVPVNGDASRNSPAGGENSEQVDNPKHGTILYPNPTTGIVSIAARNNGHYEWVKVLDAQGRVVSEQRANGEAGVTSLDLKALPTGLYQVQLFNGKTLVKERVVKQ